MEADAGRGAADRPLLTADAHLLVELKVQRDVGEQRRVIVVLRSHEPGALVAVI
jgi:hypothetical protein